MQLGPILHDFDGKQENERNKDAASLKPVSIFYLALLLPFVFLGVSCNRGKTQAANTGTLPPPLVSVVEASAKNVPQYLDEIGRNTAFESVNLMPQVSGRVAERRFQDGDNLKKGQLLFVIDPSPFKAQLDSAKASLAQAQSALELAKVQFARDQELVGTRAISKQDYDTKKSTVDQSEAQVGSRKSGDRNGADQLGLLLHPLSHRRPRRRSPGRCRKRRASKHDFPSVDPAN